MKKIELEANIQSGKVDSSLSKYDIDNDFLKYKHRIVIGINSSWRKKVFKEHHSTHMTGHEGMLKTYHRLKKKKQVLLGRNEEGHQDLGG